MNNEIIFGDLSRTEQVKLFEAKLDGLTIQILITSGWMDTGGPVWLAESTYRVKPAPLEQDAINWYHVGSNYLYMARDGSGVTFLFRNKPVWSKIGCVWASGGDRYVALHGSHASYVRGTVDAKDSLVCRGECA